ncbi:MAG: M15 family metallopeptidase [Spirulinaceae cyanobacterium]
MKPYSQIPIKECGEPLVAIPLTEFAVESPHPYEKLGAPYGVCGQSRAEASPYYLRQGVLEALILAQQELQHFLPGGRIKIFDAYRPVEVQQFMVDYTFTQVINQKNLKLEELSTNQQQEIWQEVYKIWAIPSYNLATPPPHSTGAAIDITLVDSSGKELNMGSEIDELSARSQADYYAKSNNLEEQQYHNHRELLHKSMGEAGFKRHRDEWWHFSLGDQMWAWLWQQENSGGSFLAKYGRMSEG